MISRRAMFALPAVLSTIPLAAKARSIWEPDVVTGVTEGKLRYFHHRRGYGSVECDEHDIKITKAMWPAPLNRYQAE